MAPFLLTPFSQFITADSSQIKPTPPPLATFAFPNCHYQFLPNILLPKKIKIKKSISNSTSTISA